MTLDWQDEERARHQARRAARSTFLPMFTDLLECRGLSRRAAKREARLAFKAHPELWDIERVLDIGFTPVVREQTTGLYVREMADEYGCWYVVLPQWCPRCGSCVAYRSGHIVSGMVVKVCLDLERCGWMENASLYMSPHEPVFVKLESRKNALFVVKARELALTCLADRIVVDALRHAGQRVDDGRTVIFCYDDATSMTQERTDDG